MSRAEAAVAAGLRENNEEREGRRQWVLSILLGCRGGLTLQKLHTKCVLDRPNWTRGHVQELCMELATSNRAHKQGDRWFHGPGATPFQEPSAAPKVEPPKARVVGPGPVQPLPPRGALRAPAPAALSTQPTFAGVDDEAALYPSQTAPTAPRTEEEFHGEGQEDPQLEGARLAGAERAPAGGDAAQPPAPERTEPGEPAEGAAEGQAARPEEVAAQSAALLPAEVTPSVRWEEPPPGVPGESSVVILVGPATEPAVRGDSAAVDDTPECPGLPSPSLSPSSEEPHPGSARESRATPSAGDVGQPAGASAGREPLAWGSPSAPGPSGDRQPEPGGATTPPVSPPCPPSQVSVSEVLEHAPVPTPGVGANPEGAGSGLSFLRGQTSLARSLLLEVLQGFDSLEQLLAQAEAREARIALLDRQNAELWERVTQAEAELQRLQEQRRALRQLLEGP